MLGGAGRCAYVPELAGWPTTVAARRWHVSTRVHMSRRRKHGSMIDRSTTIRLGSRVCVRDHDGVATFTIVDSAEADPIAERVSADSPLGLALLGRRVGDLVQLPGSRRRAGCDCRGDQLMGGRRLTQGRPIVFFRGVAHEMDDHLCRLALLRRQVDGEVDSIEGLAKALDISRSTASRWFSGRPGSLAVTLRILDKLGLRFDEVFRPLGPGEVPDGTV